MAGSLKTIMLLLAVLVVVDVTAQRFQIARPILLVIAGLICAVIPGLPPFTLAPELVLMIVLPPLIYMAGVQMSWREFRFNLRPIGLLAVGGVVFTTLAVGLAAHSLLAMPWSLGFLLGAIVAPPDPVAPMAIARQLGMPRRIAMVLEGEGVANDATALIIYRFAIAAIATGVFSLAQAIETFSVIVVGELVYGLAVGWLALRLRRAAHNPRVEITLSVMTPFASYWLPEHVGGSGVVATITCGLYVSWKGPLLISSATRLQGVFFWDLILYLVEGLIFLVMGLQLRTLVERIEGAQLSTMVFATALTTLVVIVARFVWVFPATYVPRWISKRLERRDPAPHWQVPFVVGFTGVRGVVSLAAALAIPITTANGEAFPQRDLILVVTFGVIIITLVAQGSMLPWLIRRLGLARGGAEERRRERAAELVARADALDIVQRRLEAIAGERATPDEVLALLRIRHEERTRALPVDLEADYERARGSAELRLELIAAERELIYQWLRDGKLTDEARRRIERELDLEEATLASVMERDVPL